MVKHSVRDSKDAKEEAQRLLRLWVKKKKKFCILVWSWQFMNAYRKGLTGAAAAWAVHKQKQHRAVSVMMAIDMLMNPAAPVAGVAEA